MKTIEQQREAAKKRKHFKPEKRFADAESTWAPGTKSINLPATPSPNPDAPFGLDDNGQPIKPMRSDTEIAGDIKITPGLCPHKANPEECLQCRERGVRYQPYNPDQSVTKQRDLARGRANVPERDFDYSLGMSSAAMRASDQLDQLFNGRKILQEAVISLPSATCECFRELLGLDRDDIAAIWNTVVENRRSGKPEGDPEVLEREIEELEARILTRSAAWQKRHRPDDILPKKDRERLKREDAKERDDKKEELKQLRGGLRRWEATPSTPIMFGTKYPIVYQQVHTATEFVPDKVRKLVGQNPYHTEVLSRVETDVGDEYNIEGYRKFINLEPSGDHTPEGWVEWENRVILQAIKCGLIKPNVTLVKSYPGLDVYEPLPDSEPDDPENTLIIKTGGAEIMGGIRGGGIRNGRPRPITDFGKTTGIKNSGSIKTANEAPYIPNFGDDSDSYTPD